MDLKCTNSNGEIVLAKKLNHLELSFKKIVIIAFRNESYKLLFLGRCSKCLKNKIVHNFLLTNPNGMNQNFPDRQKYNLQGKKLFYFFKFFQIFSCCPLSPLLSLFGHNFCSWAPNEKIYNILTKFINFSILRKIQEIRTKFQPIGTFPKSHLSPEGTMVLQGLNQYRPTLKEMVLEHLKKTLTLCNFAYGIQIMCLLVQWKSSII